MQQEATKVIKLQLGAPEEVFRSLDGQSKICNWLYNHLLEKANALRQEFIQTGNTELAKKDLRFQEIHFSCRSE